MSKLGKIVEIKDKKIVGLVEERLKKCRRGSDLYLGMSDDRNGKTIFDGIVAGHKLTLKAAGLGKSVFLIDANDDQYFFIASDKKEVADRIAKLGKPDTCYVRGGGGLIQQ